MLGGEAVDFFRASALLAAAVFLAAAALAFYDYFLLGETFFTTVGYFIISRQAMQ